MAAIEISVSIEVTTQKEDLRRYANVWRYLWWTVL